MRWLRRGQDVPPRAPEYGRVAPWLLVGPALDSAGYRHLADQGVTHVLDLRSEASDDPRLMESLNLAWRQVPIEDRAAPTSHQLAEINAWLDGGEESQPIVYVHCEGGLGRSPTIAMALLMQRGFSHAEAHRLVVGARSVAAPTGDQDGWLAEIERELGTGGSSLPDRG
ncbi:MAG TPA: dual specificity protein phosphatase [Candidatus Limnocylindrales bacterium]|nr:dual specificity protein phosphatase [Candidatus Limnocylindrales bacterium]